MKVSKIEAVAVHEAGHAVMSLELGHGCERVTIVPEDRGDYATLGHMEGNGWPKWFDPDSARTPRERQYIDNKIMVLFAGHIAEAKARGRRDWVGAGSDFCQAEGYASCIVSAPKEYARWLWKETENGLNQPHVWKQVTWLAAELLKAKTMSGRRVRRFLLDALNRENREQVAKIPITVVGQKTVTV